MPDSYRLHDFELFGHATTAAEPGGTVRRHHWQGPAAVGALRFTEYDLPGGLLTELEGSLQQTVELQLVDHQPCIGMVVQLAGHSESVMEKGRRFRVEAQQDNLLYEPSPDVRHVFQPAAGGYHAVHLRFEPTYFTSLVQDNAEWLPLYEHILPQQRPGTLFDVARPSSPQVLELLGQLRNCPYSGTLQRLYLEARFLDLFVAQQQHYLTLRVAPARRRERDLLLAVRDYLDEHYANPPGLHDLARLFGTNDFLLKKGFRELFDTTVFGYVAEKRLTEARALLTHSDAAVQDVAARVGFSNAAHFATAFKRRFGLTPQQVRRPGSPGGAGWLGLNAALTSCQL
ncbi:AraC family transcriptional regulator [Hymenobacter sp. 15J16-1T3B]|uniref:helix-turn-helix transcriptional regulator n=1 Tax=Hymenobacter sp. 15J16-1T3B TaxID=2886941 RepID=UPI001D116F4E|nr:AraC family transcriptional regulator [Hymenobacter sp. 15J16-1T3B]MCC3156156.1 AraC family transcriptional regulator [Hymenobacter sp. 15J16-1T3B]